MRLHRLDVVFMITRAPTRLARASRSSRDGAVPTQELYDLLKKEGVPYEPNTGSDCEVLIPLYVKFGLEKACSLLRGPDLRGKQISGAPRHLHDIGSVTASARWRGGSQIHLEHRARSTRPNGHLV